MCMGRFDEGEGLVVLIVFGGSCGLCVLGFCVCICGEVWEVVVLSCGVIYGKGRGGE